MKDLLKCEWYLLLDWASAGKTSSYISRHVRLSDLVFTALLFNQWFSLPRHVQPTSVPAKFFLPTLLRVCGFSSKLPNSHTTMVKCANLRHFPLRLFGVNRPLRKQVISVGRGDRNAALGHSEQRQCEHGDKDGRADKGEDRWAERTREPRRREETQERHARR